MEVSIIIPSYHGGEDLISVLRSIYSQSTQFGFEVIIIDSGSQEHQISRINAFPVRCIKIPKREFNHGLTRDLGANYAKGKYLVFLNQDAIPADDNWLEEMILPFLSLSPPKAVQGLMKERKDMSLFFWHSCGERFYFTSESKNWISRFFNMGFSTVNCAIRRDIWSLYPFEKIDIMEDKKFQSFIHKSEKDIVYSKGLVYHSHNYTFYTLSKRCQNEGYGWRLLGEQYTWRQMFRDIFIYKNYRELARGLISGEIKNSAEILFPIMRPIWLFKGNCFNKSLR